MMAYLGCRVYLLVFLVMLIAAMPQGYTDPRDVFAINGLHAALSFPSLPGWLPFGGDPCGEGWQGVQCVNSNITGIILNGANLGGVLGQSLGFFASIIQIDLSNNHIGGSIPSNLPGTIRSFFLSGNQFSGSIPDTLSLLGQLTDLSFSSNQIMGVIPDVFQQLTGLINLDLSGNNLSGQLPPSMENLASLTTLHLQNNRLIGTLNILQDLPLRDLNIENNLFSGPIPDKLLNIPDFRRTGNPFNTTVIPSPPAFPPSASPPSLSPSGAPPPKLGPRKQANGPSASVIINSARGGKSMITKMVVWIVVAGVLVSIVLALVLSLLMSQCCKENKNSKRHEIGAYIAPKPKTNHHDSFPEPCNYSTRVPKERIVKPPVQDGSPAGRSNSLSISVDEQKIQLKATTSDLEHKDDHSIDMTELDSSNLPPPPQTPPFILTEGDTADPILSSMTRSHTVMQSTESMSSFTIASLQQYTNSFSEENLIGRGILGSVYRAELRNGRLLAVKKLDTASCRRQSSEDFLELVSNISKLRHTNIAELTGYCADHGQRLLIYEYCQNGTLYEALHDDEIQKKLSWNSRMRLALQAARALEYLHEVCQPPIIHRNFKSANLLLDDELAIRVSDCGLGTLMSSISMSQLQGHGYGAPELEMGSYNCQSDVYSFGVVMLELLTGRKAYDRTRPRGEQYLVRWAIPQLHDIDALTRMVDPYLDGVYISKSLSRFADIISLSLQMEPEFRPPMSEIVENLLHMIQL